MSDVIILHANDIHGRIEGLAQLATLVEQIRAENPTSAVLFFDAGDVEETSVRLSSLTKGTAMYRLLQVAGCDAGTVGNGSIFRYGHQVLAHHAEAGGFPLVLANLRLPNGNPPDGIATRHILHLNDTAIGLIGVTAPIRAYETFFNLTMPDVQQLVRDLAASLWQDGVDMVVLLSHLGLNEDMSLAHKLQDVVNIIIGAHSHHLLPEGERVGNVLVTQAGEFAQHLGRIDLAWNDDDELVITEVAVIAAEGVPPSASVLAEVATIEAEVAAFLAEPVAELAHPLNYEVQAECGMGNLAADALRQYMQAEIGVAVVGQAFGNGLDSGTLQRLHLWEASDSSSNPGVVELTGSQLRVLIAKGLDMDFAADTSVRGLRGRARGLIHLSGASVRDGQIWVGDEPLIPEKVYSVAATDFELEANFGYVQADWQLKPRYEVPTILREAVEAYLMTCPRPLTVPMGRVNGTLLT